MLDSWDFILNLKLLYILYIMYYTVIGIAQKKMIVGINHTIHYLN